MSGFIAEYYDLYENTLYQMPIEADSIEQATDIAESYLSDETELVNIVTLAG